MYPPFIEVAGVIINVEQISFVDFRAEASASIVFGAHAVTVQGDDIETVRRLFQSPLEPFGAPTPPPTVFYPASDQELIVLREDRDRLAEDRDRLANQLFEALETIKRLSYATATAPPVDAPATEAEAAQ